MFRVNFAPVLPEGAKQEKEASSKPIGFTGRSGGELGIRTPEAFRPTAFRVLHLRPLGQLSIYYCYYCFPGSAEPHRAGLRDRTHGNGRIRTLSNSLKDTAAAGLRPAAVSANRQTRRRLFLIMPQIPIPGKHYFSAARAQNHSSSSAPSAAPARARP